MRISAARWQGEHPPPSYVFQKTRIAFWLFALLFSFDRLLQNSLLNYRGFWRSLSAFAALFWGNTAIFAISRKKSRKIFNFAGKRSRCRGPPTSEIKRLPQISEEQEAICMGFYYAKEKRQFDLEWNRLQKEYSDAGMSLSSIEAMRSYDWEMFLSRRTYENHTQALPDTYLNGEVEGQQSALFKKFSSLSAAFDEEDFSGRYAWIGSIGNTTLSKKLAMLPVQDLELLTFIILEEHDQCELARIWGCSQSAISQRLKKIKKFLK